MSTWPKAWSCGVGVTSEQSYPDPKIWQKCPHDLKPQLKGDISDQRSAWPKDLTKLSTWPEASTMGGFIWLSAKRTSENVNTLFILCFTSQRSFLWMTNKYILENASEYTVTITVIDEPPTNVSSNIQQQLLETVLHHNHVKTTRGLPDMLQVTMIKQYDIIENACIDDGLLNGAHYTQINKRDKNISSWMCGKKDQLWTPTFAIKCKFLVKTIEQQEYNFHYSVLLQVQTCITQCNISESHCWHENSTYKPLVGTYALCGIK